jgi:hypothetical protein
VPELAHNYIKRRILVRESFSVTFTPIDLDMGELSVLTRPFQQLRREVQTADSRAGPRRGNRHDAGPAGNVEHALAGDDFGVLDQPGGRGVVKISTGTKWAQPCL